MFFTNCFCIIQVMLTREYILAMRFTPFSISRGFQNSGFFWTKKSTFLPVLDKKGTWPGFTPLNTFQAIFQFKKVIQIQRESFSDFANLFLFRIKMSVQSLAPIRIGIRLPVSSPESCRSTRTTRGKRRRRRRWVDRLSFFLGSFINDITRFILSRKS